MIPWLPPTLYITNLVVNSTPQIGKTLVIVTKLVAVLKSRIAAIKSTVAVKLSAGAVDLVVQMPVITW